MICIEDGQRLNNAKMRVHRIDLMDFMERYIGFAPGYSEEPISVISLRSQALLELLETATTALRPRQSFVSVFLLDGKRVEDLASVPANCKVLLFSTTGMFRGIQEDCAE